MNDYKVDFSGILVKILGVSVEVDFEKCGRNKYFANVPFDEADSIYFRAVWLLVSGKWDADIHVEVSADSGKDSCSRLNCGTIRLVRFWLFHVIEGGVIRYSLDISIFDSEYESFSATMYLSIDVSDLNGDYLLKDCLGIRKEFDLFNFSESDRNFVSHIVLTFSNQQKEMKDFQSKKVIK
jgi:hypothetical protein